MFVYEESWKLIKEKLYGEEAVQIVHTLERIIEEIMRGGKDKKAEHYFPFPDISGPYDPYERHVGNRTK